MATTNAIHKVCLAYQFGWIYVNCFIITDRCLFWAMITNCLDNKYPQQCSTKEKVHNPNEDENDKKQSMIISRYLQHSRWRLKSQYTVQPLLVDELNDGILLKILVTDHIKHFLSFFFVKKKQKSNANQMIYNSIWILIVTNANQIDHITSHHLYENISTDFIDSLHWLNMFTRNSLESIAQNMKLSSALSKKKKPSTQFVYDNQYSWSYAICP